MKIVVPQSILSAGKHKVSVKVKMSPIGADKKKTARAASQLVPTKPGRYRVKGE
jgi:hypothetical protein